MPVRKLKPQILRLPEQPGVYLFLNEAGETIYVGKARSLRDRVRSYLGAHGASPKTDPLLDEAASLETIVTDSVVEALALENNLIKQRRPRYNILLRDDKNYPYLQLTTGEPFPRVLVARQVARDGHFYAGPYMPASLARRTMGLTHRLFGIRSCNEEITGRRGRPCLEYDIKRCIAPCVASLCGADRYREAVAATTLFLEGRNDELIEQLQTRMTRGRRGGAVRGGGGPPRRRADGGDAARSPAEDGHRGPRRARRRGHQARAGRCRHPGLPGAPRPGGRARRSRPTRPGASPRAETAATAATARCCRRRSSSSTRSTKRRPRSTSRQTFPRARSWRSGSARARAARFASSCRNAATGGRWSTWRCATRRCYQSRLRHGRAADRADHLRLH